MAILDDRKPSEPEPNPEPANVTKPEGVAEDSARKELTEAELKEIAGGALGPVANGGTQWGVGRGKS